MDPTPEVQPPETTQTPFDDPDGDFGDFQAFADTPSSSPTSPLDSTSASTAPFSPSASASSLSPSSLSSPNSTQQPHLPNIFDLDMFAFQEFVTNFEETLLGAFEAPPPASTTAQTERAPSTFSTFTNGEQFTNQVTPFAFNHAPPYASAQSPSSPIHSQEDIMNDCPIWYNLTGSYRCKAALDFLKSSTFTRYVQAMAAFQSQPSAASLKKKKKKLIKAKPRPDVSDLPANMQNRIRIVRSPYDLSGSLDTLEAQSTEEDEDEGEEDLVQGQVKGQADEEDELANDLDMHSLILNSGTGTGTASGKAMLLSADEIIEEIESLMEGPESESETSKTTRTSSGFGVPEKPAPDPLLSLNASTLLDAAIQTWQSFAAYEPEETQEFCSLPATLNSAPESVPESSSKPKTGSKPASLAKSQVPFKNVVTTAADPSVVAKLSRLSSGQLNELYLELEAIIQIRSEILISQLALRDELETEKEQKNAFISLLLSVQNKRRYYTTHPGGSGSPRPRPKVATAKGKLTRRNSAHAPEGAGSSSPLAGVRLMSRARLDLTYLGTSLRDSFRGVTGVGGGGNAPGPSHPVYLTTVIPYRSEMIIDSDTLEMLIKLLTAMDEDSPTVPGLLTDYILKVICP